MLVVSLTLQNEWRIGNSGQISYIHALIDLIDFRKLTGVSSAILHNFAVVEMFLKRARRCISKKMRMNFSMELDIETLERKGHWATMKELQHVIPFHLPRYKRILELCKKNSVNCSEDLTFATRFHRNIFIFEGQRHTAHDISIPYNRNG